MYPVLPFCNCVHLCAGPDMTESHHHPPHSPGPSPVEPDPTPRGQRMLQIFPTEISSALVWDSWMTLETSKGHRGANAVFAKQLRSYLPFSVSFFRSLLGFSGSALMFWVVVLRSVSYSSEAGELGKNGHFKACFKAVFFSNLLDKITLPFYYNKYLIMPPYSPAMKLVD